MALLAKSRAADRFEPGAQKHFLNGRPIVEKLVLVALAKIQIDDFHRCFSALSTPRHQFVRSIEISPQYTFGVGDDNPEAAAGTENALGLPRQPLSVLKRKMLQHMLAEDTAERLVGERQRPAEINQVMDILIAKPIDIHPVNIVDAPRAGTEIQKYGCLTGGEKTANAAVLPRDRISGPDSKKMRLPARYCEEAVAEKKQEKLAQGLTSKAVAIPPPPFVGFLLSHRLDVEAF